MLTATSLRMAIFALVAIPAAARADSFVISSGTAVVEDRGPGPALVASITGGAGSLAFRWFFPTGVPCVTGRCAPGDTIMLTAHVAESHINVPPVENVAVGRATFDGVSAEGLAFGGDLRFSGPSFVLPSISSTDLNDFPVPLSLTGPFSVSGSLSAYRVLDVRDPQLMFTTALTGRGTATMTLLGDPSGRYSWFRTEYDFAPVPEPATLLLFGTGVVAGCARRRRARSSVVNATSGR